MAAPESKIYSYYKDLPPWAKGVAVVGGLLALYVVGNQIIKKIRLEAERKKAEENLLNSKNELELLINQGVPRSYDKSTYDAMAQKILEALQGCDSSVACCFGVVSDRTDLSNSGKVVYDQIIRLNNDRDFLELVDSFGIRTWDDCGWGTGNIENKTIYEGLGNELDSSEIKYLNKILSNRGINKTF